MSLPSPVSGSTALVTGASSGIGEALARRMAARGHHVTLVARRRERLDALAADLGGADRALVVPADLAREDAREGVAAAVEDAGLSVDVLVNAAGFGVYAPFHRSDRAREVMQVRVDVEAVVDLTARYLPGMVQRGRGAVINLASTAGFQPLPGNAGYAAAKAHVLMLSEAINEELRGTGVTVTAVCPGPVPTEFQDANEAHFAEKLPRFTWTTADRVAEEAVAGAERGRRVVIPGGPLVRLTFAPNRYVPIPLALAAGRWLMGVPRGG